MYRLESPRRCYDWGSTTLLQQFLGETIDGNPLAEVWMGAHPDDASVAVTGGRRITLSQLIKEWPQQMLGDSVLSKWGPQLPFLAKFLAAAEGLSIQVHPTVEQAIAGYLAEKEAGVPHDAPERTYKDRSHKPEIVYPLTSFELLSGLREPEQSAKLIESLYVPELAPLVAVLRGSAPQYAHREAFRFVMEQRDADASWVEAVTEAAGKQRGARPEMRVVAELGEQFSGDPGVIAPLLMNYERLAPGQVVYTAPGTLHAYLRGLAVEVMASSDNVLRAALTSKHVDSSGVLAVSDFTPGLTVFPAPTVLSPEVLEYRLPDTQDFAVQVVTCRGGTRVEAISTGPRIAICIEGEITAEADDHINMEPGDAIFIADAEGAFSFSGNGTGIVAYVPLS